MLGRLVYAILKIVAAWLHDRKCEHLKADTTICILTSEYDQVTASHLRDLLFYVGFQKVRYSNDLADCLSAQAIIFWSSREDCVIMADNEALQGIVEASVDRYNAIRTNFKVLLLSEHPASSSTPT